MLPRSTARTVAVGALLVALVLGSTVPTVLLAYLITGSRLPCLDLMTISS